MQFLLTQPGRHGADADKFGLAADLGNTDALQVEGDGSGAGVRETQLGPDLAAGQAVTAQGAACPVFFRRGLERSARSRRRARTSASAELLHRTSVGRATFRWLNSGVGVTLLAPNTAALPMATARPSPGGAFATTIAIGDFRYGG